MGRGVPPLLYIGVNAAAAPGPVADDGPPLRAAAMIK